MQKKDEREYEKVEVLSEKGSFALMAGIISDMFSAVQIKLLFMEKKDNFWTRRSDKAIKKNIAIQMAFLDSKEVAAFCDCSDNLIVEKLKKEFLQKATAACGI